MEFSDKTRKLISDLDLRGWSAQMISSIYNLPYFLVHMHIEQMHQIDKWYQEGLEERKTWQVEQVKEVLPIGSKVVFNTKARKMDPVIDKEYDNFGTGIVRDIYKGMRMVPGKDNEIFVSIYFPDYPRINDQTKSPMAYANDIPLDYISLVIEKDTLFVE